MNKKLLVVTAVVVAAAGIVYMVKRQANQTQPVTPPVSEVPLESLAEANRSAMLLPLNDSGQNGTVTLEDANGQIKLTIELQTPNETPQPAHVHVGSCLNSGEIRYPLNDVVDGRSETLLRTTMAQLTAEGELAVNLHKSAQELSIYTSCADLE